ncbi:ABC transporter substrate-binding protein [Clostridium vincentii]|uniref:Putative siderophore-binding lipoprotein YfiY n=1 Tax=Clostridium vincentii TaxID=52704 RepID=A0A2T0BJN2_9CLOT|nr:ABC transporter substrate-binding protein [Clostridium vincentii]PRR84105.1 putative siderophore-binding lipoprotein YfiY precursor [Clostridium vincentii]
MKKIKNLIAITIVAASVLALVACTGQDGEKSNDIKVRMVSTVKGDVEIPANPKRIVDISGSSEELVILGLVPVATANVDSYQTDRVASYIEDKLKDSVVVGHSMMDTMDIEGILAANPDLIIMSERQSKIYEQLKDIAPVVMMKDYANDWRAKLTDVSTLLEKEEIAADWLKNYDEKAKNLGQEILDKTGQQTYLTVLAYSGSFMIFSNAGIGTIVNDDMGLARPENLPPQDGITLPTVSMEGLSTIDADHIIVIGTGTDKADLEKSSVWANLRAVKEGNSTFLNSSPYFSQSYNPIGKELLLESIRDNFIK